LLDELAHKPIDRALLDCLVELTAGRGPLLDAGCGPGQIGRYLRDRGAAAFGIDLSPEMVRTAAALHPGMAFVTGDLCALPLADGACAGIAAFYAIVHFAPGELGAPLAELARVLAPGGWMLVAFHVGTERIHRDELWGVPVALDFQFFPTDLVAARLVDAG